MNYLNTCSNMYSRFFHVFSWVNIGNFLIRYDVQQLFIFHLLSVITSLVRDVYKTHLPIFTVGCSCSYH